MKKITLSMVSILLMGGYSFAGGKNGTLLTVPIAQVQDEVPEDYFYGGWLWSINVSMPNTTNGSRG